MIVIGTSVLIDALHGKQAALRKILELEETGETLCTTQINGSSLFGVSSAPVTGIRHFFMVLCALYDYEVSFRKPPMFLNIKLRILTAETQSPQRRGNLPYYQHLKKLRVCF